MKENMPNPWHKTRRSVETDYNYYDPPSLVWRKINQKTWPYRTTPSELKMRDLALMCLLYMTCCRVGELTRAELTQKYGDVVEVIGTKNGVTKDQFIISGNFIRIRRIPIIKRRWVRRGDGWVRIKEVSDYPTREEVVIPRVGELSKFADVIELYLNTLEPEEELFKFKPCRAWQIVNHATGEKTIGEMPHYLRAMGLKLRSRVLHKNIKDLQDFSGHQRVESLAKYLGEEDMEQNLLKFNENARA